MRVVAADEARCVTKYDQEPSGWSAEAL